MTSGYDSSSVPSRSSFALACLIGAAVVAGAAFIAWWLAPPPPDNWWLARFLFLHQDLLVALGLIPLLAVIARLPSSPAHRIVGPTRAQIALVAIGLILICWIGHRLVFGGYDLSRDEQLANFDAAIYARGLVFAPLDQGWRPWADALNQTFLLPIGNREGWVSAYLPVNAAARALLGSLTSPMFAATGAMALWSIARRLWPEDGSTQWAVLLLYAGSSQLLIAGMTAYAMSGHVALNLFWLALFLRGGRAGHGGAMLVGLFATGLHQPLFHPLFVLPFLDMLLRQQRYRLLTAYAIAYAGIAAFWLGWPIWVAAQATTITPPHLNVAGVGYLDRLLRAMSGLSLGGIGLMMANLVRFVTWQHLLALPLAILGVAAARGEPLVRALAVGLLLPVVVMLVLLPYQGHGWGYRYLHGLIGNLALLGGYGWAACGGAARARMAAATAASIALLFPLHAWQAQRQAAPYAALDGTIAASGTAIVIVDDDAAPFAQDLVINDADLGNRPIRLKASAVPQGSVPALCRRGTIAILGADRLAALNVAFGLPAARSTSAIAGVQRAAAAAHCTLKPL